MRPDEDEGRKLAKIRKDGFLSIVKDTTKFWLRKGKTLYTKSKKSPKLRGGNK